MKIGSEKKIEKLAEREETLVLMKTLLERYAIRPSADLLNAIKEMGLMSKYYKNLIERCDAEGWEKYYQISEDLRHGHQQLRS